MRSAAPKTSLRAGISAVANGPSSSIRSRRSVVSRESTSICGSYPRERDRKRRARCDEASAKRDRAGAGDEFADTPGGLRYLGLHLVGDVGGAHDDHADAHVEG